MDTLKTIILCMTYVYVIRKTHWKLLNLDVVMDGMAAIAYKML